MLWNQQTQRKGDRYFIQSKTTPQTSRNVCLTLLVELMSSNHCISLEGLIRLLYWSVDFIKMCLTLQKWDSSSLHSFRESKRNSSDLVSSAYRRVKTYDRCWCLSMDCIKAIKHSRLSITVILLWKIMPVVSAQCDAQPKEVYYFQKLAYLIIIRIFVFYDRNHSVAVAHRLHAPGGRDHACHIRFSASDWWVKLSITARGAGLVSDVSV